MASFGMLRCVALVRTDVSEENIASFISVTRVGELETTLALTSNRRTLRIIFVISKALVTGRLRLVYSQIAAPVPEIVDTTSRTLSRKISENLSRSSGT
jgi:hypothetical protein